MAKFCSSASWCAVLLLVTGLYGLVVARDGPTAKGKGTEVGLDLAEFEALHALLTGGSEENGPDCKAFCNSEGASLSNTSTGEEPDTYECWGKFGVICKPSNESIKARFGMKCEGHFLVMNVSSSRIVACEGASKHFDAKVITPPSEGAEEVGSVIGFKAGACVGTRSFIIKVGGNDTDGVEGASELDADNAQQASAAGFGVGMAEFLDAGEKYKEDVDSEIAHLEDEDDETVAEARCHGFSVAAIGAKKKRGSQTQEDALPETADDLEAMVDAWSGDLGLPIEANERAVTSAFGGGLTAPSDVIASKPHGACAFSCNGKPAWLHGKFPCWGKSSACCSVEGEKGKLSLDAVCKGFYSGWFGHFCHGFSASHVEAEPSDDAKPEVETRAFCVGVHGAAAKKGPKGFIMAASCKGQATAVVQVEEEDDDESREKTVATA